MSKKQGQNIKPGKTEKSNKKVQTLKDGSKPRL